MGYRSVFESVKSVHTYRFDEDNDGALDKTQLFMITGVRPKPEVEEINHWCY